MRFTKMEGLGNDYLYVYGTPTDPEALSVRLSNRHFGIGADGMIWIEPSEIADFKMRIFNADGSEAKMCGNGIRCVGKYVYDKGLTQKTTLTVETLSGIRTVRLLFEDGAVTGATVDMGSVTMEPERALSLADGTVIVCPVSVGNPHAVCFVPDAEAVPLASFGPAVNACFEGGVNVECVSVTGDNALRMRVYERGSGITMACGTGACAAAYAAWQTGRCKSDTPIAVRLDGGTLSIGLREDGHLLMTGPANTVFEGKVTL